ncbi:MAG TPA: alpha/beta hydrolase-fold protein [Salegentibacter sp.]|nr:alpha/beta hydrolase-fold protein [Salegentibacter sp.]
MKTNLLLAFFGLIVLNTCGQAPATSEIRIIEHPAPELDTIKTIRIYLPASYEMSEKRYPVIYMHDAQNLFDKETAFAGEWEVDESLDASEKEVIIVGIDHGDDKRIDELTPFPNEKYGGGNGDAYVNYIVKNLKPYIDKNFRSKPQREHTGIFGSSLGGLISFYGAIKHPETFGKVGVFSPSFWFSDSIYDFAENAEISENVKFYFLAGTEEDETLIPNINRMIRLLEKKVFEENLVFRTIENGEHNENLWREAFPEAIEWLQDK